MSYERLEALMEGPSRGLETLGTTAERLVPQTQTDIADASDSGGVGMSSIRGSNQLDPEYPQVPQGWVFERMRKAADR